jgi:hypothetical protein
MREKLTSHIQRIKNKNPVVNASHLIQEGIKPGILMGKLLKKSENIAIEQLIEDPEKIISKLKQSNIWPHE